MNPNHVSPSREVQREIIRRQREIWVNTRYEAKVQLKIAEIVDNEVMQQTAKARYIEATTAIGALDQILSQLTAIPTTDRPAATP